MFLRFLTENKMRRERRPSVDQKRKKFVRGKKKAPISLKGRMGGRPKEERKEPSGQIEEWEMAIHLSGRTGQEKTFKNGSDGREDQEWPWGGGKPTKIVLWNCAPLPWERFVFPTKQNTKKNKKKKKGKIAWGLERDPENHTVEILFSFPSKRTARSGKKRFLGGESLRIITQSTLVCGRNQLGPDGKTSQKIAACRTEKERSPPPYCEKVTNASW